MIKKCRCTIVMSQNVLIIDSGMKHLNGHNFSYTRAVERALERCGYDTTVFSNRALLADLRQQSGYCPVFSLGAYDFPMGAGVWRDLVHMYAQSVIYSDELESAFGRMCMDDYG